MNILYIDHYAGSMSMGMEFRPYYMAREWRKLGHKVRIIGADYSHLRVKQPQITKNYQITEIDGEEYQIIKAGIYEGNGAKRAISMFRFVGSLCLHSGRIAEEFKPDIVISSSTYPLDSYAANRIAKKSKGKYIHEAHDVWPLTLVEIGGMSKSHPFVRVLNHAEKYAYKHCNKVVSILPNTLPHMLEQGLQSENKFIYVPNGVVMEDWMNAKGIDNEHKVLFDKLHEEGKFIVEYLGGHAISNALDQLIDAAKLTKDAEFVLVGKGVEKERLMKRVQEEKIENVHFLPPVPKNQVPSILKEADALYIGAEHSSLYRFGVSMNKMYDYMMSGKPVLNGVVASNNEVEEAHCGLSFDSSKPEEIANAVNRIKQSSKDTLTEMGKRGSEWVKENCDYTKLAMTFLNFIKQ